MWIDIVDYYTNAMIFRWIIIMSMNDILDAIIPIWIVYDNSNDLLQNVENARDHLWRIVKNIHPIVMGITEIVCIPFVGHQFRITRSKLEWVVTLRK